ncbi:MAG: class I SAM-dependent methyltransferase [Candidatus Omnitrophica bacterium]|nr:class I SAM-dependent methyltransferase [Candidatus Omnitrophota bacterium]
MMQAKSWSVPGGPGSWLYRGYDALRRRLNRRLVGYLAARACLAPGSRVLEGGSGPAFASSLFARESGVALSIAADLDAEALREARRRDPALPAVQTDLYRLPFRSGVFDLVWSSSTLEHLAAPASALEEMQRVTKDGGYLFVGVPARRGPLGFQPWIKRTRVGVWLGPVFSRAELLVLMAQQGLRPVSMLAYGWGCFVGVLARKPVPAPAGAERVAYTACCG